MTASPAWSPVDDDTADLLVVPNRFTFRRGTEPSLQALLAATVVDRNGCLVWQRSVNTGGYGQVSVRNKRRMVHRLAWELTRGPIPGDLTVDHMCFNTRCINVEHLRLLTVSENASLSRRAISDYCKRGHRFTAENTSVLVSSDGTRRRHCRQCKRLRYIASRQRLQLTT